MALDLILEEVKTVLGSVADIGRVHVYERYVSDEAGFRQLFLDGQRVRGWTITRERTEAADRNVHTVIDTHVIVMRAYVQVDDANASESAFQKLIETVRRAFLTNRKLNGMAFDSSPVSARAVGWRMLAGVLCHYAELELRVQEYPVDY